MKSRQSLKANDLEIYCDERTWTDERGPFASLRWLAKERAKFIPIAQSPGARLLDVGCGGGSMVPWVAKRGYEHVGFDRSRQALDVALGRGLTEAFQGDAASLPFEDEIFDVALAGQFLEHVSQPSAVIAEMVRVLKPGGTIILDTISRTWLAKLCIVHLAEGLPFPGLPPGGTHDAEMFIPPERIVGICEANNLTQTALVGLFPHVFSIIGWMIRGRGEVPFHRTRNMDVLYLYQGVKP